ncbi:MAG: redoxin domain-containing protein [Winogradskyella sp.]|nr:MAG: redoxin domain-containing protein [Winogradskyella sp.]
MKKLVLILCSIAIISCKEEKKDYTILSGKIENIKVKTATLVGGDFKQEISISKDGTFSDTLKLTEARFYNLGFGRDIVKMFIGNGQTIKINANAEKMNTSLHFEGNNANENNYLNAKVIYDTNTREGAEKIYSLDETAFKSKIDDIKNVNLENLNTLENADETFLKFEKENLNYEVFTVYDNYENMHKYFTKKEDFKISEDFLPEGLKNIEFDNPELYKMSEAYKQMGINKSLDKVFANLESATNIKPKDLTMISDIKIQELKNDVISFAGKMLLSPANENMSDLYTFFSENVTNPTVKATLTETFEKGKKLLKGMPSPEFVNYENNAGGETSLKDLRGKYVYVDVWATWCGPCIGEIPSLKKVEKQFHGKNIEFVSASIDTKNAYDKWKSMIKEKELGGTQLLADNAWQSKFVQDYAIDGIPRFILIDPDGNIVSADAPRPSNPELVSMLDSELNKTK